MDPTAPMSNSSVLDRFGIANDVTLATRLPGRRISFPGIEQSTTVEDIHIVRLDVFQDTAVELCCSADGKAPLVVKQSNPRESCCMKLPYPVNLKTHEAAPSVVDVARGYVGLRQAKLGQFVK